MLSFPPISFTTYFLYAQPSQHSLLATFNFTLVLRFILWERVDLHRTTGMIVRQPRDPTFSLLPTQWRTIP